MISDKILISDRDNACAGIEEGLEMVERAALSCGYDADGTEALRKLANEMVEGCASILDVFSGTLWVETDENTFNIMLEMEGAFTQEEREDMIALTRDNKNTLPKGLFARLGVLLGDALTGAYIFPYGTADIENGELLWGSAQIAEMTANMDRHDPADERAADEAKRALDTLADDIRVAAQANRVLITTSKALPAKKPNP